MRLIDADKLIQKTYGVVIEDMFHMHETLAEVKSILDYNKTMLTYDMSISRDPEHQEVSPDYYGKDAENLYYAIVFIEEYLDNSIPIEWIKHWCIEHYPTYPSIITEELLRKTETWQMMEDWEKENGK